MSNKKKALITGILGQDGPYLAKLLLENDYDVYGLMRRYANPNFSNTDYLQVTKDINFLTGDMTDESSLLNIVRAVRPDEIYNLASQSFVGESWSLSTFTTEVNALGPLYLLNAMKNFCPNSKFYQASTSELYGNSYQGRPLDEYAPFAPRSPYAISKLYGYWITNNFKESYGLYCVNGILFNHESPIRGSEFVTRKITQAAAKAKLGLLKDRLYLGNIDARRDWGFAGDYVRAMWLIMQQETPDNYVVCTGETHSIRDFLDLAFRQIGIKDWRPYVAIDPRFKRPADVNELRGTADKARRELGWQPQVSFPDLVAMMVEADIKRLSYR